MQEYILIFRHQNGNEVASPEQIEKWMKQTSEWISEIAAQHKFVSGTGITFEENRVVTSKSVVNSAFGEKDETVSGFVIVRAESVDEAVGFAQKSPVLQGDQNSVEVRRIATR